MVYLAAGLLGFLYACYSNRNGDGEAPSNSAQKPSTNTTTSENPEILYCKEAPDNQGTEDIVATGNFSSHEFTSPDCSPTVYIENGVVPDEKMGDLARYTSLQNKYCLESDRQLFDFPKEQPCRDKDIFVVHNDTNLSNNPNAAGWNEPSGQLVYRLHSLLYWNVADKNHTSCIEPIVRHELTHSLQYHFSYQTRWPNLIREGLPEVANHMGQDLYFAAEPFLDTTLTQADFDDLAGRGSTIFTCTSDGSPNQCDQGDFNCCAKKFGKPFLQLQQEGQDIQFYLYGFSDLITVQGFNDGASFMSVSLQIENPETPTNSMCLNPGDLDSIETLRGAALCMFGPHENLLEHHLVITPSSGAERVTTLCHDSGFTQTEGFYVKHEEQGEEKPPYANFHNAREDSYGDDGTANTQSYASSYCAWREIIDRFGIEPLQHVANRLQSETEIDPAPFGYSIDGVKIFSEEMGLSETEVENWMHKYRHNVEAHRHLDFHPFCSATAKDNPAVVIFPNTPELPSN